MNEHPLPLEHGWEILRTEVGSTLHGTGLPGGEDHDEMGIFVERPRTTIGLHRIEHYEMRTADEGQRSQPGDTDLICYSLRKWASLALKGNPSVLLPLFAPAEKIVISSDLGAELRSHASWFASRRAGRSFQGYMARQRARMTGERGKAGRIRSMPDGAVDWKYAMHMLRLGHQGVEFLSTGRLTLPIPDPPAEHLRAVRRGHAHLTDVLHEAAELEAQIVALLDEGPLPAEPEWDAVERFVIRAHQEQWAESLAGQPWHSS